MKPTIRYLTAFEKPMKGRTVVLHLAEDHYSPDVRTRKIETSTILRVESDDTFETLNTIYKKA